MKRVFQKICLWMIKTSRRDGSNCFFLAFLSISVVFYLSYFAFLLHCFVFLLLSFACLLFSFVLSFKVGKMPANKHICHASGIYLEIPGNTGK